MIRCTAALLIALAVFGCAAQPAPPPPPPQIASRHSVRTAARRTRPLSQYGGTRPAGGVWAARLCKRKDGATEMWRYDGAACRAFFFFYGMPLTVRHVETLPHGAESAADPACLTALRVSPAKTS